MANSNGMSRTAGRVGMLLAGVGVLVFFIGIFGGPRWFTFAGVALIAASLVSFFVEEQAATRA